MKKISFIFGTRPEAIKLAPVILEIGKHHEFEVNICVTAQHRHMLDQVLEVFNIEPDIDLNIMKPNQSLPKLTANAINKISSYLQNYKPHYIIIQGDTTTVFAAALAAFYQKIPVGHVEAGLRTWNKYSPFPEEINRVLTTKIADLHFAPTSLSKANLIKEGVNEQKIVVTGNTIIDALFIARSKILRNKPKIQSLPENVYYQNRNKMVLITGHRRENFGAGFDRICKAISILSEKFPKVNFVYPVHLNPNVQRPVYSILGNSKNVFLIEPQNYLDFISLMIRSSLILTDSGGVQEEGPSLGKPVLVMRDNTERPEGIYKGSIKIVGTHTEKIVNEVSKILENNIKIKIANPYGDGKASERIVKELNKAIC